MSAEALRQAAALMRERAKPPVAFAVADWLDAAADEPWCCDACKFDPNNENRLILAAVAVARAYLGGDDAFNGDLDTAERLHLARALREAIAGGAR